MRLGQIDIEVDPFALRGNLKFLISLDILEVRTNKYLGDVPVPETECLRGSVGRGIEIQLLIRTSEQEVEVPFCPARADFRTIAWHRHTIGTSLGVDSGSRPPEWTAGIGA